MRFRLSVSPSCSVCSASSQRPYSFSFVPYRMLLFHSMQCCLVFCVYYMRCDILIFNIYIVATAAAAAAHGTMKCELSVLDDSAIQTEENPTQKTTCFVLALFYVDFMFFFCFIWLFLCVCLISVDHHIFVRQWTAKQKDIWNWINTGVSKSRAEQERERERERDQ